MRARGLADDGRALPVRLRPCCGARTRRGRACSRKVVPGRFRCRLHGGLSTGPRSLAGKARIAAAQRRRWAKWRRERGASALP
nr:HGGxSTG domain-containing protein [Tabrizicola sp. SY72]